MKSNLGLRFFLRQNDNEVVISASNTNNAIAVVDICAIRARILVEFVFNYAVNPKNPDDISSGFYWVFFNYSILNITSTGLKNYFR